MKNLFLIISTFLLLLSFACNRKSNGTTHNVELHENCFVKHDPGPCRMAIEKYYYDSREKKCKKFIYGGCKGVVPFETLKECQKKCGCE